MITAVLVHVEPLVASPAHRVQRAGAPQNQITPNNPGSPKCQKYFVARLLQLFHSMPRLGRYACLLEEEDCFRA